jgi:hypothetical protein
MSGSPRQVRVYADWVGLKGPCLMGRLSIWMCPVRKKSWGPFAAR